jgi:cellulose biosynthesis protein BcsQ
MGRVLSVVNMKGGVGKTTTVVSLCEVLATEGAPILVIDVDAQANASFCLAGDQLLKELIDTERTVDAFFEAALIDKKKVRSRDLIRDQVSEVTHLGRNLDISLFASSANLRLTEREIVYALTERKFSLHGIEGQTKTLLKRHLDDLRKSYSYIIFDCAPGISAFTSAAVSLADLIIVPTLPDFLSHLGLTAFIKSVLVDIGRGHTGVAMKPHVLVTRKKNTREHNKHHQLIGQEAAKPNAPFKLFDTFIPEAAAWPTAIGMIGEYPSLSQKYPPPLGSILAALVEEIKGAFRDDGRS